MDRAVDACHTSIYSHLLVLDVFEEHLFVGG